MAHGYWNDWYFGWGWLLWIGLLILLFASIGNWGYTYSAHRRHLGSPRQKSAIDVLDERYAKGEITRDEYRQMKLEINAR